VILQIPELSLVLMVGPSGCGKSTFARKHFLSTEIISSDHCRGLVSDDEGDQSASKDAFEILHFIAAKRLARGRLTVIDATNVQPEARKSLVELARQYHVLPAAIVLHVPERTCLERNRQRTDRQVDAHVIKNQAEDLRRSLKGLEKEGFRYVHVLDPDEVDAAVLERQPLWNNRKDDHGPFDIIGDIHGCIEELRELLTLLGYQLEGDVATPPAGRKAIFVGDLVDRGPGVASVLRLVMAMTESGAALCVPGNHDIKLLRKLRGKDVPITHGIAETLEQLDREPAEFREHVGKFLDGLVSHYVLDDGKLVVAHAGMKEEMQGRGSAKVRDFALYGETTGETDEFGLPVRLNWAAKYRGKAMVVYGHTPVPEAEWLNHTVNIDTGCVFGGKLTAVRYPEEEFLSVHSKRTYYQSLKPFLKEEPAPFTAQQQHDDLLNIEDVMGGALGKRVISTRLQKTVTIQQENCAAALEAMSRFAANPKWLIYLPPTMSPSETSRQEGYLEYPDEAFAYYRKEGVEQVICEQKHMGSRAVVIVCRDEGSAQRRFGVAAQGIGICYTRTGRPFFADGPTEHAVLERVHRALTAADIWSSLRTDWVCLDCELMPWSAKAQELLRVQYASTGAAAMAALPQAIQALEQVPDAGPLLAEYRERLDSAKRYVDAYRHYCWPVHSVDDLKLAPFHILASENGVHVDRDHDWHMKTIAGICAADAGLLLATPFRKVDLADRDAQAAATLWWEEMTKNGGEGMVVKPLAFVQAGKRGMIQPAIKCRGREYLRVIYGPEYTRAVNLERLRKRSVAGKRSLALKEFALGLEALERFVRKEPLRQVHECVFGVLALESEAVDPRL
jgi:polynucleotide kinase-phosphatase